MLSGLRLALTERGRRSRWCWQRTARTCAAPSPNTPSSSPLPPHPVALLPPAACERQLGDVQAGRGRILATEGEIVHSARERGLGAQVPCPPARAHRRRVGLAGMGRGCRQSGMCGGDGGRVCVMCGECGAGGDGGGL
eukprot:2127656-Rhodomonas_salina.1